MDIERIRSFVAQIAGGLASERTTGSEHQGELKGAVEAAIPLVTKATGDASYHYLRSQSETKSLHDHIFEEFYQGLRSTDSLTELSNDKRFSWDESNFKDGHFILAKGMFKLIDYNYTIRLIQNIPNILDISRKSSVSTGQERQQREAEIQKIQAEYKKIPVKEISSFIDQFYDKDSIRVKIFPFPDSNTKVFVGSAAKEAFRYPPLELFRLYGTVIDAAWHCLLQVNKGTFHQRGKLVSSTGNQLEDAFENMADTISALSNFTHGITFPAVAMTPIAIYREA
jgi:hypothetical protein